MDVFLAYSKYARGLALTFNIPDKRFICSNMYCSTHIWGSIWLVLYLVVP